MLTGIGIVALAGIIVNNNIVLVDTFNVLRLGHPDWSLREIIVQTGVQRLRPVFLTTFTTGFGLLPLAMGISIDLLGAEIEIGGPIASQWAGLASTIVFGLSFATILTLRVTPAMLALPQKLKTMLLDKSSTVRKHQPTLNNCCFCESFLVDCQPSNNHVTIELIDLGLGNGSFSHLFLS